MRPLYPTGLRTLSVPYPCIGERAVGFVESHTWIKEQPGSDDGQWPPLPLRENQPLQYQSVAATGVSVKLGQRGCGSWNKKKTRKNVSDGDRSERGLRGDTRLLWWEVISGCSLLFLSRFVLLRVLYKIVFFTGKEMDGLSNDSD